MDGPEGCIQTHQEDKAFLKFTFKEKTYQFRCLPFSLACPMGLHQDPKATRCSAETAGNATNRLHRRHSYSGRVQASGSGPCYRPNIPTREPRFCDKQTKKHPGTYLVLRIPWVLGEFSSSGTEPPGREGEKDQGQNLAFVGRQAYYSQKAVPASGKIASSNQGSTSGPSVLPQVTMGTAEDIRTVRSGLLCPTPQGSKKSCNGG